MDREEKKPLSDLAFTSPAVLLSRHSDAKRVFEDRRGKRKEEKLEDKTPKRTPALCFSIFYFRALGFFSLEKDVVNTSPEKRADFLHISYGVPLREKKDFHKYLCSFVFLTPMLPCHSRVGVWLIGLKS